MKILNTANSATNQSALSAEEVAIQNVTVVGKFKGTWNGSAVFNQ